MKLTATTTRPETARSLTAFVPMVIALGCMVLCLTCGCTSSTVSTSTTDGDDTEEHHHHDHGHRPESYSAALASIKHARDEVKAAFDAGTPKACDEALHEVAEVLDVLPEVAAETDLPKNDWQVVKNQSTVLFDQFMQIHNGFHGDGKQGASFDSVEEEINKAIDVLDSKLAATGEKIVASEDTHDHEGHDHDEHGHEHGDHDQEHEHEEHDHDHDHDEHGHE